MVQINFAKREVQCKVVYYGPARSGKTTNLRSIHERSPERVRGQLTTIATDTNRTLFFDFLPLDLGDLAGIRAKVHLYAIPYITGQNAMRVLVLEGVDGIVFVADAAPHRLERNREAFENLRENLAQLGRDLADIPVVWQWNKTDLPDAMNEADLDRALNPQGQPAFPAAAEAGTGVFTTLKAMTRAVLADVSKMMVPSSEVAVSGAAAESASPARSAEMPAPRPPARPAPEPRALPGLDSVPRPAIVPLATPGLPDTSAPTRVPAFGTRLEPEPAGAEVPAEADPDTESRPLPEMVPVPVPQTQFRPLQVENAAEEPATYVPPWHKGDDRFEPAPEPEPDPVGPTDPQPQDDFEFTVNPNLAGSAESGAPEAESYPEPFTDLAADETDPDPTMEDQKGRPHTTPLPPVPAEAYRARAYDDPTYDDEPGYGHPGRFAPAAAGTERYVSVGGPTTAHAPEIIHGWDEHARTRRRLVREARPVVDRRKSPRADVTLQNASVSHLAAGAAFGLLSLIAIGYLVHALL